MKKLILAMALFAMACGTDDSVGVGGQDAELHCRAWCDDTTGCAGAEFNASSSTGAACLSRCRGKLAEPCSEHSLAEHECITALECNDQFGDCRHHYDEYDQCRRDLDDFCDECPGDGQDAYQCFQYTGECGHDRDTARCDFYVREGRCPSVAACMADEC